MRTSDDTLPSGGNAPEAVEIEGVVERIVFSSAESGFVIAEVKPAGRTSVPVTVKGVLPGLRCGESVSIRGRKVRHPSFGMQIEADSFSVRMPASVEAMRKFLGSGLVAGVGKGYADKIVTRFGEDTARILSEESARLREIPGLGAKRAALIKTAWDEQRALREVVMFLQTYGVGVRRCMRIVKEYGGAAPQLLKSDPYALARDVDGIGFRTADRIALNMGLASDSAQRIQAGLVYAMGEAEAQGHTALPSGELLERAAELLGCQMEGAGNCLRSLVLDGALVDYNGQMQLPATARAEEFCAKALRVLADAPSGLPPVKVDAAVEWAGKRAGFDFAPEQAEAVAAALESGLCVITGGPGTGKTSILRAVVDILRAKKARVLLASPTGRAAQRLAAATGMQAATLHRLLRFNAQSGAFDSGSGNALPADMVIVDEVSMLDVRLASALLRGIAPGTHLLLVGDADQLPSVGPGNVLADIIASGLARVVRLKRVFRQSEGSGIVAAAARILAGDATLPEPVTMEQLRAGELPEVALFATTSPAAVVEAVVTLSRRWRDSGVVPLDMQVLSPMHKGRTGIQALNGALQEALNANAGASLEDFSGLSYREGDKVICTRNNYDKNVFNGDMGIVSAVNTAEGSISVAFEDQTVTFARMELVDLMPAYAISIHKSQGSEFDDVVIPIMPEHLVLLRRNLLYTAITRAKRHVVIAGSLDAWRMALSNRLLVERNTTLSLRINARTV
jgi:exodeoxyribonuclease V alpha subunit